MLDYKDNHILKLLINSDIVLTIKDLQKSLGMSERSVYYSLERINDYFMSLNLPLIINKRNIGLIIDDELKDHFESSMINMKDIYICTSKERNNLQILLILLSEKELNISVLMEACEVSRSTIIKDLRRIRKILYRYDLMLEFKVDAGYEIDGVQLQKRILLLIILSDYLYLIKLKSIEVYKDSDVAQYKKLLVAVEDKLGVKYVRSTLSYLTNLLAIIKFNNLPKITLSEEDMETVVQSREYEVVSNVFKGYIGEDEFVFVALHLLGLRIQYNENIRSSNDDEYVVEIVNFIINEFYNLTEINFKNQEELYHNLYIHMKQALFRFKFGIVYKNELKDQIISEFAQVYRITKIICEKLEKIIGFSIGDDEITFIAIYFGGLIGREQHIIAHPKVLLVCLNGNATSKMLRSEIESFTRDIEIIEAFRQCDMDDLIHSVDFIITTLPLKNIDPSLKVLTVNPILNNKERFRIINFLGLGNVSLDDSNIVDNILADLEEYILETKIEEVKKIIASYFNQK